MAQYRTCEICGANLDPGEICDCTKKEDASPAMETPSASNNKPHVNIRLSDLRENVNNNRRKK